MAPAAHQIVPLFDFMKEPWDVGRVVLKVTVHRDQNVPAGVAKAGGEGGRLAVISSEKDELDVRILLRKIFERGLCPVAASVIDKDDFGIQLETVQHRTEPVVERPHAFGFVVNGDDDGEFFDFHGEIVSEIPLIFNDFGAFLLV